MKLVSRLTTPLLAAGVTASALVFAATGCGSGGGTAPAPGTPLATSSAASFAGRSYASTIPLSEGQVGNLSVTTAANGTVSGTLQIVDPSRAANPSRKAVQSRLVIAAPLVSGTIDFATGVIHLSGAYTINGQTTTFSITGTLPTPPSYTGGSITTTINGHSYTSTFGGGGTTNPMPTPSASATPSPSSSATPAPTPSPSGTPAPTGPVNTLTVTAESGTNANNRITTFVAAADSQAVTALGFRTGAPGNGGGTLSISAKNNTSGTPATEGSLTIDLTTPGTLATGTYPVQFGTGSNKTNVLLTYLELNPTHNWQSYFGGHMQGEGQVIIEQVDDTKVRVRLDNVRLDPAGLGLNGEKGTLHVSGILETTAPPFLVN